jgi:hypothetical protein
MQNTLEIHINQVELLRRDLVNENLEFVTCGHNADRILLPLTSPKRGFGKLRPYTK